MFLSGRHRFLTVGGMASKSPQVNELIICPICFEAYQEPTVSVRSVTAVDNNSNLNTVECPDVRPCYYDVGDSNKWVDSLPNNHLIVILIDQGKMENK